MLPPVRFSTRTDCPIVTLISCVRMRVITFVGPPVEQPTRILMGLVGKSYVTACNAKAARSATQALIRNKNDDMSSHVSLQV